MSNKIMLKDVKEGMRFTEDVFFDDGENMLAPKGMPLKKREITALKAWEIPYLVTKGEVMAEGEVLDDVEELESLEELEELDEEDEPEETEPIEDLSSTNEITETKNVDNIDFSTEQILKLPAVLKNDSFYEKYLNCVSSVDSVFEKIKNQDFKVTKQIDTIINSIIGLIEIDKSLALGFILGGEIEDKLLAKSSVNTAILSLIIAEYLNFPDHRIKTLATAAILHDIGMFKVPTEIINKEGKLDDGETTTMRAHTNYGQKMIVGDLLYSEEIGRIVLQHHEHWDGNGYPSRIEGKKIDLLSRIIAVADAFEAMVSPKSWRNSLVGYETMKNLIADNGRRFDPNIIRAMVQCMGIYPIGSIVLINNSAIARVVESNKETPIRPIVRILIDEFGKPFPENSGDLVNLKDNRNMFIARAIESKEYRASL